MAVRQSIIDEYKKGKSISALSQEFCVSRRSVQTLIKRYESKGIDGLRPHYSNCGKDRPDEGDFVYRAVRYLRHLHWEWGSEKIRAELQWKYPALDLPHYRTMNRWFNWNKQVEKKCKTTLPLFGDRPSQAPHDCWQIDAKEELRTADGKLQCWLNITDEYTGMVIEPSVFPLKEDMRGRCTPDTA